MSYVPPTNRSEAVDEVMRTGMTTPAIMAVALAFPLEGEIEEIPGDSLWGQVLRDYGSDACSYLTAWERNSCALEILGGQGS